MKLAEVVQFNDIDFDNTDIPEYILSIEKEYGEELQKHNYILEQSQYDQFSGKFARIHDWLVVQYARAKYLKKKLEDELDLELGKGEASAPEDCKTGKARERWVQLNNPRFQEIRKSLNLAEGYFSYFEKKIDAAKMNHYLCKGMSGSIDKDKGIGGFQNQ